MRLILASSIAVMVVLASGIVNSQENDRDLAATKQFFEKKVQPVLRANCFQCHSAKKQEGDLRIDQLDIDVVNGTDAGKWEDVLERINSGEMPPEKSQQLTTAERRELVSWLTEQLDQAAKVKRATGGHAVLRRLNRYEYQNTMRDLLGIDLDYTSDLPPDGNSEDGFKNNGQFLGISSIQLELYHRIARDAIRNAIVTHPTPKVYKVREEVAKRDFITWEEIKRRDEISAAFNKANPKDKKSNHGIKRKPDQSAADANETTDDDASGRGKDKGASKKDAARPKAPRGLNSDNLITNRLAPGNWYDVGLKTDFTKEGLVRVRINCYAVIPKSGEVPRLRVGLGYRSTRKIQLEGILGDEVDVTSIAPQTFEFVGRAEDIPMPVVPSTGGAGGKGAFHIRVRNVARGKVDVLGLPKKYHKEELQRQAEYGENDPRPILVINWAEYEGPIFKSWPPEHHTRWLPSADPSQSEESRTEDALVRFMERAYRRPVKEAEVEAKLTYFQEIRSEYSSFDDAMREVFSAVLVSPHFLYLVETKSTDGSRLPLTDFELASRLSYFFWSTIPDEELFSLAREGRLHEPETLSSQVDRLLDDERSSEFTMRFSDQWLGLENVDRVAINPEYYSDFDDKLKQNMRKESRAFFAEVLRKDLSCLNFIDSEFAMLNLTLAEHYGITGPLGGDFVRVNLKPEHRRGGLLTQGSMLLSTSNGEDSHPVKRGVWVLEKLLGEKVPSPPANVPDLSAESVDTKGLTFREKLKAHVASAACNNCHRNIDPWGFPLDDFNAIGQLRTHYQERLSGISGKANSKKRKSKDLTTEPESSAPPTGHIPVNTSTVLSDGRKIDGLSDLKALLLNEKKDQFASTFVRKLMAYGLGRSLELSDRQDIDALAAEFKKHEYRMKPLIQAFVRSHAFQTK